MKLKSNKTAIVTGGVSGLGLAVVQRFLRNGISVAMLDISEEKGEACERELRLAGGDATFFPVDVTVQKHAQHVTELVARKFGRIDTLVNAAGLIRRTPAGNVADDELSEVLDANLKGTVYMCQSVQPYMAEAGGGAIVNFGSMLAYYGSKNLLSYAASKGGVIQVTKCFAVEWASLGIRVNAVSPGYIETPLSAGATQDPVFRERVLSRTPQGRFGKPEEVAAVIDFLCSEDASFVTGVSLPVDGGLLSGDPSLFPPSRTI